MIFILKTGQSTHEARAEASILLPNTEVDEDIYLENTYLLTSLTSASYVG